MAGAGFGRDYPAANSDREVIGSALMLRSLRIAVFALPLLTAACSDDDALVGPKARFDLDGERALLDLPFPSDLHRAADGHVELPRLPTESVVWDDVRALLRARSGFCTTCTVHFPLDGPAVDPALAGLRFDPDHILFIGESLGTIAGTAMLTTDAGVSAAVLGVSPGSLVDVFCESPVYRTTMELISCPSSASTPSSTRSIAACRWTSRSTSSAGPSSPSSRPRSR